MLEQIHRKALSSVGMDLTWESPASLAIESVRAQRVWHFKMDLESSWKKLCLISGEDTVRITQTGSSLLFELSAWEKNCHCLMAH